MYHIGFSAIYYIYVYISTATKTQLYHYCTPLLYTYIHIHQSLLIYDLSARWCENSGKTIDQRLFRTRTRVYTQNTHTCTVKIHTNSHVLYTHTRARTRNAIVSRVVVFNFCGRPGKNNGRSIKPTASSLHPPVAQLTSSRLYYIRICIIYIWKTASEANG